MVFDPPERLRRVAVDPYPMRFEDVGVMPRRNSARPDSGPGRFIRNASTRWRNVSPSAVTSYSLRFAPVRAAGTSEAGTSQRPSSRRRRVLLRPHPWDRLRFSRPLDAMSLRSVRHAIPYRALQPHISTVIQRDRWRSCSRLRGGSSGRMMVGNQLCDCVRRVRLRIRIRTCMAQVRPGRTTGV